MAIESYDVIVVGAGNAAACAAMSAQENGAKVVLLERAPEEEAGGNSRFAAGSLRFAHNGLIAPIINYFSRGHVAGETVAKRGTAASEPGAGEGEVAK